jgi:hypothetical protein
MPRYWRYAGDRRTLEASELPPVAARGTNFAAHARKRGSLCSQLLNSSRSAELVVANGIDTSLGRYIKGVFCLEGEWTGNLKRPSSLEPILQLLRNRDPQFSYVHRFVVTKSELDLYLQKWTLKKFRDHPILYLACHGSFGTFFFNSSLRDPGVDLDHLEDLLRGKCKGRVICFGSCGALDI